MKNLKHYQKTVSGLAVLSMSVIALPAYASETLTMQNFIGTVTINTQPNADLQVTDSDKKTVSISEMSGGLIIDGNIKDPNSDDCAGYYGKYSVSWFKKPEKTGQMGGYKNLLDYPNLIISGPEDLNLVIENSIPFMTVGNIGSLDAKFESCGKFKAGDVSGPTNLQIKGSADVVLGNIQDFDLSLKGSGDVETGNAAKITLNLMGSGNIEMADVGTAQIKSVGSGDIEIDMIRGDVQYETRGSGDFEAGDITGNLNLKSRGSGDFSADSVSGRYMSIESRGSGSVDIDGGDVETLFVTVSGSGDIRFDGTAVNAELKASGSSEIYVDRITGDLSQSNTGSSDIEIGDR